MTFHSAPPILASVIIQERYKYLQLRYSDMAEETEKYGDLERIFIGVKLPAAAVMKLSEVYSCHMTSLPGVKWEKEENLHVTLRFIGDMTCDKRFELQNRLAEISCTHSSFTANVQNISTFGSKGDFRILHCMVSDLETKFENLRNSVDNCIDLCEISYDKDERRFSPHVTLARNRRTTSRTVNKWIEHVGDFDEIAFQVGEFQLIQSVLSKESSSYVTLQSYPLTG